MWLNPHLQKACRVIVARVDAASKCRKKGKKPEKPILVADLKETPPPYVLLYPPPSAPLPSPLEWEATSDGEAPARNMPTKLDPGVLENATIPPSSRPVNLMLIPSPPILILHLKLAPSFNQEHFSSPTIDLASPLQSTALQMTLREVQGPIYYDHLILKSDAM
jgi:hypothetical protein